MLLPFMIFIHVIWSFSEIRGFGDPAMHVWPRNNRSRKNNNRDESVFVKAAGGEL